MVPGMCTKMMTARGLGQLAWLNTCVCVATGFDLGFWADNRHFINNHLMFKILVYKTNGQYTKARKRYEEMEAASVVEVRYQRRHSCWDT